MADKPIIGGREEDPDASDGIIYRDRDAKLKRQKDGDATEADNSLDRALDDELEDTFPASDPPSITTTGTPTTPARGRDEAPESAPAPVAPQPKVHPRSSAD